MPGKRRAQDKSTPDAIPRKDWCTGEDILGPLRKMYSEGIALDPCDNLMSQTNAKVSIMLPEYQATAKPKPGQKILFGDGLKQDWLGLAQGGLVFVNFPYGRKESPLWAAKCLEEGSKGCHLAVLGPSAPATNWFRNFWLANVLVFPERLAFLGADHKADFESFIAYWSPRLVSSRKANDNLLVAFPNWPVVFSRGIRNVHLVKRKHRTTRDRLALVKSSG